MLFHNCKRLVIIGFLLEQEVETVQAKQITQSPVSDKLCGNWEQGFRGIESSFDGYNLYNNIKKHK